MTAESRTTDTIPEWKKEEVSALKEIIQSYETVGIVDVTGIPSRQLQEMRRDLHGTTELRIARNTFITRALEDIDEGVEKLDEFVSGQIGILGSDANPFGLYRELEASKTPAPINAGEVAPNDIVIPEGDTGIDPGPFVGDLQQVGANARIQEGSIHVLEDSVVCEQGETVSDDLANVLSELGIEPKEVGLDLRAVYADGVLFLADELELDIDEYWSQIQSGVAAGRNVSINTTFPTAETTPILLNMAAGDAIALGQNAKIESPDVLPKLITKAETTIEALANNVEDEEALPKSLRETASGSTTEEQAEETTTSAEEEAETEDDETEEEKDEEEDGGEALGDMFG
ncbi:MAG: 50S ribosomal protein L10 [Halobacteriaceae archaeon]